ncbi:15-hydroxyprostaglandin dehydrogenase, NAD+ [Thraustotheca clavata]|uniref:15-hydroxyprostaglandin dehydrogenase, NAD n=1 Tax=Thraustotheca clavata TaxID=74557 RepID=A0A1W0ADD0_9STRA|nr:15-hydroxyprostaglandin dehydrogenase, NAD+ [Thraustotheca clavata]
MQLEATVAIITGAAQGLGLAFSKLLLENGGSVFMTDINLSQLSTSAQELQAQYSSSRIGFQFQDVCDDNSFDVIFDAANNHFGSRKVNLLVNNAGINSEFFAFYKQSSSWRKLIEINLIAVMRGTQVALRRLPVGSLIVNVASAAGLAPTPAVPEYGASKVGVVYFTSAVAKKTKDIRVVAFCPAFVDTPMAHSAVQASPKFVERFGGLMTTEYAAQAFQRLLQDDTNTGKALFVTNQVVQYQTSKL